MGVGCLFHGTLPSLDPLSFPSLFPSSPLSLLSGTSKSSVVPVRTSHAYRAVGTSRTAGDSDHTHTFTSQGKLETTHEKAVIHETTQGKERKGRRRRSEESRDRVVGQRQVEELIKQLEEVTLERDALRDNSKKASTLETKTNRLEQKVRDWEGRVALQKTFPLSRGHGLDV